MSERIIVLNSGGFDSVTLLNFVCNEYPDAEITSLFFNYQQRNLELEREKARNAVKKLRPNYMINHLEVDIAPIFWTNSSLYNDTTIGGNQYMEMRNLIFLSYALSLAENIKANKIFMGIIYGGNYTDTNKNFIEATKQYVKNILNIDFETPFSEFDKFSIAILAKAFGIKIEDTFSCNTPIKNEEGNLIPCGVCGDCKVIKEIKEEIYKEKLPVTEFTKEFKTNEKFEELFKENKIIELRLLINNECQFNCEHCFYGFKEMKAPQLTLNELKKVIDEAVELEIENIHFSGKEPFVNKDIFKLVDYIKSKKYPLTYDVVTNGVNILKYKKEILSAGFNKIFLSVDSLNNLTIRPENKHLIDSINFLVLNNIPLEIFIDIHKNNYKEISSIIISLFKLGVKEFHVRNTLPLGSGKGKDFIPSLSEIDYVYKELEHLCENIPQINVTLKLNTAFVEGFLNNDNYSLFEIVNIIRLTNISYVYSNLVVLPEFYCGRYENQITITPDGFVLGCDTEIASPSYDKISAGNIREKSLKELIDIGKEKSLINIKRYKVNNEGDFILPPCFHTYFKVDK